MSGTDARNPGGEREPFVMVPCRLIDEIMPHLRDTELRLLLVVLRQTRGRRNPDGTPKERDWLSHSQLKERTGRAGEAVSAAVDSLVRRGLIGVWIDEGTPLPDAAARRRCRARLWYGPEPLPPTGVGVPRTAGGVAAGRRWGKAKTTGIQVSGFSRPLRKVDRDGRKPAGEEVTRLQRERIEEEKAKIRRLLARLPSERPSPLGHSDGV